MSAPVIGPFPGIHQIAYVSNDFERAIAQFRVTHGIERFLELRPIRYETREGREAVCNVALAYVGAAEIELIAPLEGDVEIYRDILPRDGSFAVRFHHLARLFDTREALEEQVAAYRRAGRDLPINGASPGSARYFYADYRKEVGHYLEGIAYEPQARAWLASIPRN